MEGVASEVKDFFSWATKTDVILAIVLATFGIAFLILTILLKRGGRAIETKAVLDAISATRTRIDNVDLRIEKDHRAQAHWMLRLLARFGFLDANDIAKDIKKRLDDDIH